MSLFADAGGCGASAPGWLVARPLVAGVDEAGRGPLAGPVVAAAVMLDPSDRFPGLDDSKRLSPQRRTELDLAIRERAVAFALARVDA